MNNRSSHFREADFTAAPGLRSPHAQSILASMKLRRWALQLKPSGLRRNAVHRLLTTADGTRLEGWFSRQPGPSRGTVLMFPGWEGHQDSIYMLTIGARLFDAGWDVVRLNFRDHGDTHHLNEGLFHSCLLDEMIEGVQQSARYAPQRPLIVGGCSLGGNFALRVGLRRVTDRVPVDGVFAVGPVIDAHNTLAAMESTLSVYQRYFIRKWLASLSHKGELFPQRYDMAPALRMSSVREVTDWLVQAGHIAMPSLNDYLRSYSLTANALAGLDIPAFMLAARDDPIIPWSDFDGLALGPQTVVEVADHGGHCGFVQNYLLRSWLERRIEQVLGQPPFDQVTPLPDASAEVESPNT
jgi:predicted alpha/beta-fold hydrolase